MRDPVYNLPITEPPECEILPASDRFEAAIRREQEHYCQMVEDPEYRAKYDAATARWMAPRSY